MSSLQKTASQCKQPFSSGVADVGCQELRVLLLAKPCGRGCLGSRLRSLNLAVQPHLSLACTSPLVVIACLVC